MGDVPVATGDIFFVKATDKTGQRYLLGSFHGDTNGLATIPVVRAVNAVAEQDSSSRLIFGLDANTYEHAKPGKTQDVLEFADAYMALGLTSCWGDRPNPANHTTHNARTYLQPQLNKASAKGEILTKGDVNLKDYILFYQSTYNPWGTFKDNTGHGTY